MPSSLLWGSAFIAALSIFCLSRFQRKLASKKNFPSPPSEFLVGHLRAFTQNFPWLTLTNWRKDYGDILHLSVAGKSIIVLNKAEDAHNLLEKRGSNYSDRPRAILQGEIGGIEYFTGFIRYGDEFRILRRFTTQFFNSREHVNLYPLLQDQAKILLKNLLDDPQKFEAHLDRLASGTIVKSTYGFDILSNDDAFNKLAIEAFTAVFSLGLNGLTSLDLVPLLRYLPPWLPGMGILQRGKDARVLIDKMVDEPYEHVKERRKSGLEGTSLVDALLEDYEKTDSIDERREFLIKNAAGQIYGAGVETSADVLQTFIFEMIHHPEIAKKAQAEIELVIGKEQLPTLNDRPDLPYIDCILKEVMRINPAVPLGVPHASIQEDVYKDKIIPAGSIVISNIWAMARDEHLFPDPDTFNPDRFLATLPSQNGSVHHLNTFKPDDPSSLIFGFGRRICPGRFIADANAWLFIASVLSVFDILPPIDPDTGKEVLPELTWMNGGLTAKLKSFQARIVPRSDKHAQLVE